MKLSSNAKISLLFLGDVSALYLSLALALALRYGSDFYNQFINRHLGPFSIAFALWLIVFFIAGLYDLPRLRNNMDFIKTLILTLFVNAFLTITLFYLIPYFVIAPKTNLFLFLVIFGIIETWWRRAFNMRAAFREGLNRVLLLGNGLCAKEIIDELKRTPQAGYEVKLWLPEGFSGASKQSLSSIVRAHSINLVAVPREIKDDKKMTKKFYSLIASGVEVIDIPRFYELVFRKIPISEISEYWFLENHIGEKKFYDELKRGIEIIIALVIGIVLLPIELIIAILVKLTSKGPIIYQQVRVSKNDTEFMFYKFRNMRADAERDGPRWAETNDARITPIGGFLRRSHLDELPQIINILKGDMSFVGPRPERPEFVKILEEQIPYYEIRHLVKPGLTGWAQINYRYGASVEDAKEKLEYDLYYIKNRSPIIDVAIIIKTIKALFVTPK